jgi:hypothetical protein
MHLVHRCSVTMRINNLLTIYYLGILTSKVIVCYDEA